MPFLPAGQVFISLHLHSWTVKTVETGQQSTVFSSETSDTISLLARRLFADVHCFSSELSSPVEFVAEG